MTATVRVEPDVCFPSPHRHASGHRLTGQWAIPFITWEKPVARLAAAKGLEQLQRVSADTDGAGLAALAEEANVAALIQRLNVLPAQTTQLGHTAAQQIGTADHDVVPRCEQRLQPLFCIACQASCNGELGRPHVIHPAFACVSSSASARRKRLR